MNELHAISLGAGVQSSTMALMAKHGEITPMPECAVFADTKAEPRAVYEWLDWLEKQLPFPVHRVSAGSLTDSALEIRTSREGRKYIPTGLPVYVKDDNRIGIAVRQCTEDFKIVVIQRKLRELRAGRLVVQWMGISADEYRRIKPSRQPWKEHRYPLVDAAITRKDCKEWMASHGYPEPPRSACVYCPFHSDGEWRRLKQEDPESFAIAVDFEKRLQPAYEKTRFRGVPFLHKSGVPLDQCDFGDSKDQLSLFDNECEGMCGV